MLNQVDTIAQPLPWLSASGSPDRQSVVPDTCAVRNQTVEMRRDGRDTCWTSATARAGSGKRRESTSPHSL